MSIVITRRFTAREYHLMAEAGVLGPDERVELIEGEIVEMSPIGSRHARCVDRLTALLVPLVVGRAIVRVQNPVALSEISEPQPDLSLLAYREDFYPQHPGAADVLLIIEVADSSLMSDRRVKVPLYGRSGVTETWLVDLVSARVEVYRLPGAHGYGSSATWRAGDVITVGALPDLSVDVAWLLA